MVYDGEWAELYVVGPDISAVVVTVGGADFCGDGCVVIGVRISRSVLPPLAVGMLHDLLWCYLSEATPLASLVFAFVCGWRSQERHWFTAIVLCIAPVVVACWWHPFAMCWLLLLYWLTVEAGHDCRVWWKVRSVEWQFELAWRLLSRRGPLGRR